MEHKEKYMFRCLQLASYGNGHVAPNPLVGAVIVHNDKIIGEGFHKRYGDLHAEPHAINSVKDESLLKESTLFVNLEPCAHYGKTPPCVNIIIQKGIPKVVIGTVDPNPKVSGKGIEILRNAGVEVECGVLEKECFELNKRFFVWQRERRPFVLLKWAQTQDGFIDIRRENKNTPPLRISHQISKNITHKTRSENQSIMVSTNTVVLDNPSLTVRYWAGKNPVRIILDRTGRIPSDYIVYDQLTKTIVFTEHPREDIDNIQYIYLDFSKNMLENMLKHIASIGINSILVEGGAMLLNNLIKSNLWDEAQVEVSNQVIFNGVPAPFINSLPESAQTILNHQYFKYINKNKVPLYE